jgi:threonine synthase
VCATNVNDIVHRTISTGDMSMGENHQTISPAMDIQFAYNLERLVFYMVEQDTTRLAKVMDEVEKQFMMATPGATGAQLDSVVVEKIQQLFSSCAVTDEQTLVTIRDTHEQFGYALCPHSAIGVNAATTTFRDLSNTAPMICVLTAHPSKFEAAYRRATTQPPPQLASNPVDVLFTLPHKFEWLRKNGIENWREEWIATLKAGVRKTQEISK